VWLLTVSSCGFQNNDRLQDNNDTSNKDNKPKTTSQRGLPTDKESLQSKDISIKSDEEATEESPKIPASSQQKMDKVNRYHEINRVYISDNARINSLEKDIKSAREKFCDSLSSSVSFVSFLSLFSLLFF
jgi:hypothetical protein